MSPSSPAPFSRIGDLCADNADVLALSVLRFVAAGYATSDVACWDAAHEAAERMLGPVEGPQLVAVLTGIVRAIRRERADDWRFMLPNCCRATADEHWLFGLIGCARRSCRAAFDERTAELVGSEAKLRLREAIWVAAERLNEWQPRIGAHNDRPAGAAIH